ncbi:MAG: hypothetical protein U1E23_09395 [Reyranellaceae bacterium]
MNKHTPGPWRAVPISGYRDHGARKPIFSDGYWHISANPDLNPVAVVDHADDHYEPTRREAEANARLIAAAPMLLEALKEADKALSQYGWYMGERGPKGAGMRSQILAAIAAAEAAQ